MPKSKKKYPAGDDLVNSGGIGPFNDERPDVVEQQERQVTVFEPTSNETEVTERGFIPPMDPKEGRRTAMKPWKPMGRKK